MIIVEEEFIWALQYITQVAMPAVAKFKEVADKRKEFHPSG